MPYILYKSNNSIFTTVDDATLDTTSDLSFVGRNYSGYGQAVNENFLKLLENFASSTPPSSPLIGELWYDTSNGRLNVNYGGNNSSFKALANLYTGSKLNPPKSALTNEGDLWWDSSDGQLYAKHGSEYILVGPLVKSTTIKSEWLSTENEINNRTYSFLEAVIGTEAVATISLDSFTPLESDNYLASSGMTRIKKGITLRGLNLDTNSTAEGGYYFWGTATDALKSSTSTNSLSTLANNLTGANEDKNYITFASTTSGMVSLITDPNFYYNYVTGVLNVTATNAYYADLAERYEADQVYEVGTVLIVGGEKEVTTTNVYGHYAVAGVISKNPAYRMNINAGTDDTHPYVALKGRVPCKVVGKINKGDRLVTSQVPGYAAADDGTNPFAGVVGIALQGQEDGFGIIEIKI